jgi:hypothetical protein
VQSKPCAFRRCPAFAVVDRDHCPVHDPEKVLARCRQIVCNAFALSGPVDLTKLRADILRDMDHTL